MPMVSAAGQPYTGVPEVSPNVATPFNYLTPRATPEAFGAQIGASMERLGQAVERGGEVAYQAAIQRQNLHNKVVADDLTNNYQDEETKILYGDPATGKP